MAGIAYVDDTDATGSVTATAGLTVTPPAVAAGQLLIAAATVGSSDTITSIGSGGVGITWNQLGPVTIGVTINLYLWWGFATSSASTPGFVFKPSATASVGADVSQWTGILPASPLDQHNTSSGSSTAMLGPNLTPTAPLDLFVTAMSVNGGTTFSGLSGGFTSLINGFGGQSLSISYLISSDAAAHQTGYTLGTSRAWGAIGTAFFATPTYVPASGPRSNTAVMRAANYMKRASGLLAPRDRERIVIPQLVLAR